MPLPKCAPTAAAMALLASSVNWRLAKTGGSNCPRCGAEARHRRFGARNYVYLIDVDGASQRRWGAVAQWVTNAPASARMSLSSPRHADKMPLVDSGDIDT